MPPTIHPRSKAALLLALRRALLRRESYLARTLSDAILSAWLLGGRAIAARLPSLHLPPLTAAELQRHAVSQPVLPTVPSLVYPERDNPQQVTHFPQIELAANDLQTRSLLTQQEFAALDSAAKQQAFTVARLASLDALDKVRVALVEDVRDGGTLRDFAKKVEAAVGKSALSPAHIETVYRTNVAQAYSRGQRAILRHPLVRDEFPYGAWHATHDSRVEQSHLAMEQAGIQGTNVYRQDDPLLQSVYPPCRPRCRCLVQPLSIADAAKRGIEEAIEWQRTGQPPAQPAHVSSVPITPLPGWVS